MPCPTWPPGGAHRHLPVPCSRWTPPPGQAWGHGNGIPSGSGRRELDEVSLALNWRVWSRPAQPRPPQSDSSASLQPQACEHQRAGVARDRPATQTEDSASGAWGASAVSLATQPPCTEMNGADAQGRAWAVRRGVSAPGPGEPTGPGPGPSRAGSSLPHLCGKMRQGAMNGLPG